MSANRLKLNTNKTELLFASSSHSCAMLSGGYPVLHLGANTAVACSHVRLLGVDISSDLSLDHHVTSPVSAQAATIDFVNCVVSSGHSTPTRWLHSSPPL